MKDQPRFGAFCGKRSGRRLYLDSAQEFALDSLGQDMGSSLNQAPFRGPFYKAAVLYSGPKKGPEFRDRTCCGRLWATEFKQEGQDPTSQILAHLV